jgi:hypothetical protein
MPPRRSWGATSYSAVRVAAPAAEGPRRPSPCKSDDFDATNHDARDCSAGRRARYHRRCYRLSLLATGLPCPGGSGRRRHACAVTARGTRVPRAVNHVQGGMPGMLLLPRRQRQAHPRLSIRNATERGCDTYTAWLPLTSTTVDPALGSGFREPPPRTSDERVGGTWLTSLRPVQRWVKK